MKGRHAPAKRYTALVRRLHFLVLLAVLVPLFCQIVTSGMPPQQAQEAFSRFLPLYGMTLTLALPAAFFYFLQVKVKGLGLFLLCAVPAAVLALAVLFFLEEALSLSVLGAEQVPQALILLLYLLDAIRMRTNDNSRRKAKAQGDHSWRGDLYLLPLPSLVILLPFAVLYLGALFLHSDDFAQVNLIGAILYFFLVLPYHVLVRREDYLESRHHVNRIPRSLIARLHLAHLIHVLIPCALIAAVALMSAGGRHFLDLPKLQLALFSDPDRSGMYRDNALYRELMALGYLHQDAHPPQWLLSLFSIIENALTVLLTALIFYGIWLGIRNLARQFRKEYEKIPAALPAGAMADEHVSLKTERRPEDADPQGRSIRRRYRRIIRRFRGGPPAPYETPSMMEERSHLPDTPAMQKLHDDYERARYAEGPRSDKKGHSWL